MTSSRAIKIRPIIENVLAFLSPDLKPFIPTTISMTIGMIARNKEVVKSKRIIAKTGDAIAIIPNRVGWMKMVCSKKRRNTVIAAS